MVRPVSVLSIAAVMAMTTGVAGQQTTQKPPPVTKPAPATTKPPAPATAKPAARVTDVRVKTSFTHGAQVSQNVTYLQGPRQRSEFPGVVSIEQCDLKRSVMLNPEAKKYRLVPYPAAATSASDAAPSQTPQRGGIVTLTTTLTDTLERQQMFGLEARRVKSVVIRQPASNACDKTPMKIEVDAWYVDLPEQSSCARPAAAPPPAADPNACVDRIETQTVGDVRLGFPVKTTTTTTTGEGSKAESIVTSQEVTELEIARLDRALFEIPKGYSEASSSAEIVPEIGEGGLANAILGSTADGTSSAAPRKAGIVRIGVLEPVNKTTRSLSPMMREELVSKFNKKGAYEALPLQGSSPADAAADARRLECDYLLLVEITDAKTSKPSKIGGMMQKVSGEGAKDSHEVKLDYKLFPVGGATQAPPTSGNAKANNGGFGVGSALRLAAFAGQMYLSMGMGMGGMGMGMGMGGPAMTGGMYDPRMAAIGSVASGLGGAAAGGGDPSEQQMNQTVSEALGNAAKAAMEQLGRKK